MKKLMIICAVAFVSAGALAGLNGQPEYTTDAFGHYYVLTGNEFPNGQTYNGNNGSGGTLRYLSDDPSWGLATGSWQTDDWFPENSGLALTMKNSGATVYSNNEIEQGDPDNFYNDIENTSANPAAGLYRGYAMSNNYDFMYAGYFKLSEATTIDTLVGYFDGNGSNGFDPDNPILQYRMNIYSAITDSDGSGMLPGVDSFTGDIFSSDSVAGAFSWSDTGVARVYSGWEEGTSDPIFRLEYKLDEAITLEAGEYFFSHDVAVTPEPATMALLGLGGLMIRRKCRA